MICKAVANATYAGTLAFSGSSALCLVFHQAAAAIALSGDTLKPTSFVPETGLMQYSADAIPLLLLSAACALGVCMGANALGYAIEQRLRSKRAAPSRSR